MHQEGDEVPVGSVGDGVEPQWWGSCNPDCFCIHFLIALYFGVGVLIYLGRCLNANGAKLIANALMSNSSLTLLNLWGAPPSRFIPHSH